VPPFSVKRTFISFLDELAKLAKLMNISELVDSVTEDDHKADVGLSNFYQSIMNEYNFVSDKKQGHFYWSTLWNSISPAGNIYRYIGLQTECNRHALDAWQQLDELAEKYAHLLGGTSVPLEDRTQALIGALDRIKHKPDPESDQAWSGFPPVREFLFHRIGELCLFRYPKDSTRRKEWFMHRAIAWMICVTQILVPYLIVVDEWLEGAGGTGRLYRWWHGSVAMKDFMCLGHGPKEKLHTIMGGILLELTLLIIHSYVNEQHDNAVKLLLMPMSRFWLVIDQLSNIWCVIVTTVALPLRFWGEDNSTAIAMDSLTLLFVFMLDDLAGFAATYLGKTEESYSRAAAWQKGMLSQCPVLIADIIDSDATQADELWRCEFDTSGRLLATNARTSPQRFVQRRVMRVAQLSEDTPLLKDDPRLCYSTTRLQEVLPRWESILMVHTWHLLDLFMMGVQIIVPIWWMILDKSC